MSHCLYSMVSMRVVRLCLCILSMYLHNIYLQVLDQRISIIEKIKTQIMGRPGNHLIPRPNMKNRTGILLDVLMNLRMNLTSQAVSMVHHVTWLPWQKCIGFGFRIWLSACISYIYMQSQKAWNSFIIIRWTNCVWPSGGDSGTF